jgi:flagellum-specific peptidoglycan hydrolase FlgJ
MKASYCNNAEAVAFVKKYQGDANKIADAIRVPVEFVLGLAASESGYGRGPFVRYNNFFSIHAKGPSNLPKYATGAVVAKKTMHDKHPVYMAVFPSFYSSGMSFADKYGKFVSGTPTATVFARRLREHGFNPGNVRLGGSDTFVRDLSDVIDAVKARMGC